MRVGEVERVTFASRSGARLGGLRHGGRAQAGVVLCLAPAAGAAAGDGSALR
jgi:hypothetical protein